MLQSETSLSDLFDLDPATVNGKTAEGPSALPATHAAPDPAKPALDKMTIAEGIPGTLSEVQLADLLGIGASRVRTLARDGVLVRNPGKKGTPATFDVRASLHGYLAQLREGAVKGGAAPDELKVEKLRLAKQQADKLEIANAAARGDMVRAADVEREWANVLRDIRSTLLAVPSRVGSKLPHLTAADVAAVDREIKAALEGLANGN